MALLVTLVSLALIGAATLVSVLALDHESPLFGWAAALLGAGGLTLAAPGGVHVLDLATALGVVVFAGVGGAGWRPRMWEALLHIGSLGFVVGLLGRFLALASVIGTDAAPIVGRLPWTTSRAAGFVAFAAATGAVILGARRPSRLPISGLPARVYALHRALGIGAVMALGVHLGALWLDTFVDFSWAQLLVAPWTSTYRPFAVTLGWAAALCLLLTAASGGLKRFLPGGRFGWRAVHLLAYATFALGLFHGLLAGSDSGSLAARTFYIVAFVAVAIVWVRRILLATRAENLRRLRSNTVDTMGRPARVPSTTGTEARGGEGKTKQ